jgi:hypothetical protein
MILFAADPFGTPLAIESVPAAPSMGFAQGCSISSGCL